jgi:hypothetical protein
MLPCGPSSSQRAEGREHERRFCHPYTPISIVLWRVLTWKDAPAGSPSILTRTCDLDNRSTLRRKEELRVSGPIEREAEA